MRRWHTAGIALCLLFTAFVLLRLRAIRASSKYDTLTIRFVDESTGEAASNLTVSITESRWNLIHGLLEKVGLADSDSNTKQEEYACASGTLTGVRISKDDQTTTTSLYCYGNRGGESALFFCWQGKWRGTNSIPSIPSIAFSLANLPIVSPTNGVLTIPIRAKGSR